jgi:hypothetical protein
VETKRIKEYRVYEIGKDCRKYGVVVGTYKTKKIAEKKVAESIYRYFLEIDVIVD